MNIDRIRYALARLYVRVLRLTMSDEPSCAGEHCRRCIWGVRILGKRICTAPIAMGMLLEDELKMEKEDGEWNMVIARYRH